MNTAMGIVCAFVHLFIPPRPFFIVLVACFLVLQFKEGLTHLQSRVRRFFEGHGASDGVIVAYLPARLNEGSRLWHLEHDDGDTEDLDLGQLLR